MELVNIALHIRKYQKQHWKRTFLLLVLNLQLLLVFSNWNKKFLKHKQKFTQKTYFCIHLLYRHVSITISYPFYLKSFNWFCGCFVCMDLKFFSQIVFSNKKKVQDICLFFHHSYIYILTDISVVNKAIHRYLKLRMSSYVAKLNFSGDVFY